MRAPTRDLHVTEDACVRRDGAWNDVDAIDVVRGDLVLVQEGG